MPVPCHFPRDLLTEIVQVLLVSQNLQNKDTCTKEKHPRDDMRNGAASWHIEEAHDNTKFLPWKVVQQLALQVRCCQYLVLLKSCFS